VLLRIFRVIVILLIVNVGHPSDIFPDDIERSFIKLFGEQKGVLFKLSLYFKLIVRGTLIGNSLKFINFPLQLLNQISVIINEHFRLIYYVFVRHFFNILKLYRIIENTILTNQFLSFNQNNVELLIGMEGAVELLFIAFVFILMLFIPARS